MCRCSTGRPGRQFRNRGTTKLHQYIVGMWHPHNSVCFKGRWMGCIFSSCNHGSFNKLHRQNADQVPGVLCEPSRHLSTTWIHYTGERRSHADVRWLHLNCVELQACTPGCSICSVFADRCRYEDIAEAAFGSKGRELISFTLYTELLGTCALFLILQKGAIQPTCTRALGVRTISVLPPCTGCAASPSDHA